MRELGFWSALSLFGIGLLYIAVGTIGMIGAGLTKPITGPILTILEVNTLVSAPLAVVVMAAVHARTSASKRIHSMIALIFIGLMAGVTMSVHFVELTALRQMGLQRLAWPSVPYALELLAWDVLLGLSLLFAARAFSGGGLEARVRIGMFAAGCFCIAGASGPISGIMSFQFIAVFGYAVVLPIVFLLVALVFRRDAASA